MRRLTIPLVVSVVGLLLLVDLVIDNPSLGQLAGFLVDAVVIVAAGAALGGAAVLVVRRGRDVVERRAAVAPALAVLVGMAAMLVAGLRPDSAGADDPAVRWLVAALLIPLAATLFGILFVTTLGAVRRAIGLRAREATVMAIAAGLALVVLLPLGGAAGDPFAEVRAWVLDVPIAAVFRGLLIGTAIAAAVAAARVVLGIGAADD